MVDRGEGAEEGGEGGLVAEVAGEAAGRREGGVDLGDMGVEAVEGVIDVGLLAGDDGYVGAVLEEGEGAPEAYAGKEGLLLLDCPSTLAARREEAGDRGVRMESGREHTQKCPR